jgi:hypothetical protein
MEALAFERPELRDHLIELGLYYCQMRYRLEQEGIWDPSLAELEAPLAA